MKEDPTVVAITSGTPTVMEFTEDKRKEAGRQFVDAGIAEETAVALASRNRSQRREAGVWSLQFLYTENF